MAGYLVNRVTHNGIKAMIPMSSRQSRKFETSAFEIAGKVATIGVLGVACRMPMTAVYLDIKDYFNNKKSPTYALQALSKSSRAPVLATEQEGLLYLRRLFSDGEMPEKWNALCYAIANKPEGAISEWYGTNCCKQISVFVAFAMEHLGFSPVLKGRVSLRNTSFGNNLVPCIDHAWVEVDIKGQPMLIDLTARQYLNQMNTPFNTPHGIIGPKTQVLDVLGDKKIFWDPQFEERVTIDMSNKVYQGVYEGKPVDTFEIGDGFYFRRAETARIMPALHDVLSALSSKDSCI